MEKINLKQIGEIELPVNYIEIYDIELIELLFSNFYPISIKWNENNQSVFTGYSQLFEEAVSEIPKYAPKYKIDKSDMPFTATSIIFERL